MSDFRETLYTISKDGHRKWVYADLVRGFFYRRRQLVVYLLMAFYLLMPWITIGGEQGIFLDIAHRKFTIFGETFWATDTRFLVMMLGGLAFSLFFFTAILGRVWCGWACPETVFLEFLFRPIETLIEGTPAQRRRLDQGPWNFERIWKKSLKLGIFAILSWIIASTFLAYFVGAKTLLNMMSDYPWNNITPFLMTLFMMGVMIFQFGWFREQFCTLVCPYARFQSVLLDSDSLLVGYDSKRGEPRGKMEKGDAGGARSHGDCIDCGLCVRVCPTGIDIRNGLQLECVQCAACADACDSIMTKIGRPLGLIRYSTERVLQGEPLKVLRPRVLLYGGIIFIYLCAFAYFLTTRELSEFQIMRSGGTAAFSILPGEIISNQLHIHISNKGRETREYSVRVEGNQAVTVVIPISPFPVKGGETGTLPVFFNAPHHAIPGGKLPVTVVVEDGKGFVATQTVTLLGPD